MGNQSSREHSKKDYDVIYHIESILDIDVGWPITFPNPLVREIYLPDKSEGGNDSFKSPLKQNFKWDSKLVSIQGQHTNGKTFLINLLSGLELPKETNGLCIKMTKVNDRNVAFLDTPGSNTPIIPITTKECNLQIEEKRGTEMFLRDLTITSSDLNILVVGEMFSEVDQGTLLKMANTLVQKIKKEREMKKTQKIKNYQKTKPEILVVHNFKNSGYEEAEQKWKKMVNEMSKYASLLLSEPLHHPHQPQEEKLPNLEDEEKTEIDEIISSNSFALSNQIESNQVNEDLFNLELNDDKLVHRMEYTEELDGETITFVHLFLCHHLLQEDVEYNRQVAHNINTWISSGAPPKEIVINPLGFISSMVDLNINNYVTGTEKMGFYHLSEPLCLFYHYLQNPKVYISGFPLSKLDEEKRIRDHLSKFHLEFDKNITSHHSLLELKSILKWSVNQCEQLREWMLTSRERKVNGIPFDLFPRLYLLKWDEFVDQMWNQPIDYLLLYAISQVLKYRVVIVTSCIKCPVFIFTPERNSYKDTLYFAFSRLGSESTYSRLLPKEQILKKLDNNDRELKLKKYSHLDLLTFRSNENSKEKKLFGGKSLLKSSFVSSSLSSLFDYNQQFTVKYTTEINKKDNSLRIVIDVPYSSNDYLEYDCTLLQDPKRFKLEVKGRRELEEDWVVSEGTRKFGDWSFCYEIPKQYTIEQPDIAYTSGTLIFTFRYGEVQSTLKKIIRRTN